MKERIRASGPVDPAAEDAEEAGHARVWEPVPQSAGVLSPENRHYLERVLRLRPGARFQVTDGRGGEADAILEADGRYRLAGPLHEAGREPTIGVSLYISLIKGDRFEAVIEKAVELGVSRIVPVVASRCVARPPAPGKFERWWKIALAAMLQCGGCRLPELADPMELRELAVPPAGVKAVVLHESRVSEGDAGSSHPFASALALLSPGDGTAAATGSRASAVWILSGPEGGFGDDEIHFLTGSGWRPAWLGPRRLRADTAPIAAAALVLLAGRE